MSNKKASNQSDGDFIDLEKNQYKKRGYSKIFLFIILSTVCILLLFFFYQKNNLDIFKNFFKSNSDRIVNDDFESPEQPIIEEKKSNYNTQIIEQQLDILKEKINDNKIKFDQYESIIKLLDKKVDSFEVKQKTNLEFLYAEKYLILNDLFMIKNKFENRENFYQEIEELFFKFNDNPSLRPLLEYFRKTDIKTLKKKEYLFDQLNKKLQYYALDTNTFINNKINKYSNGNVFFDSKESFINYLKNLFDSTFKITKFDDNSTTNSFDFSNQLEVIKSIKIAKEYLILDNLEKSIKEIKELKLKDLEIEKWIQDANKLKDAIENLKELESNLLLKVGTNFDKDN